MNPGESKLIEKEILQRPSIITKKRRPPVPQFDESENNYATEYESLMEQINK
jgi:hypothetical protein